MQRLELFNTPLTGFNLIEASAGTGKTYTIAGLYLRLVAEAGYPVHRLLVVTYTKATTEELRDRIRQRLVAAREAFLRQGAGVDDFCKELRARCHERKLDEDVVIRRLTNAVRGFDEAAIFTIHGFCQRVLADNAFESGMPFETELLADEQAILQEIVDDFWRREFYGASPLLINHLLDEGYSPASLLQDIRSHVGKPYLQVVGPGQPPDFAAAEQDFAQAYGHVRELWSACQQEVEDLLLNDKGLNRNKYRVTSIPSWLRLLDDYLASEAPNLKLFDAFKKFTAGHLAEAFKNGQAPFTHPLFIAGDRLQDAHRRLTEDYRWHLLDVRVRLLAFCRGELAVRKARESVQSYDDLLTGLQRGLSGEQGKTLAQGLQQRYRAALIDEFQDTDPVQYDIFRRIFADTAAPVFLVGDPKQAIYSFRGADVFAYLKARRDTDQHYTLDVNWRSDPRLLDALNGVFKRVPQPFLFADIPFQPAVAAAQPRQSLLIQGHPPPPLRLWFLHGDGKHMPKTQAAEQAARATATEIARLLNLGVRGEACIGERPLAGGDMAVLVRNHRQGRLVRRELLRLGVPCVQQAQDSVFVSPEALELEWLLMAVAEPGREARVKAALATAMLGSSGEDLYRYSEDDETWEQRLEAFHEYHQLWREHGFMRMFRTLATAEGVSRRLLGLRDGERRLTNVLHLVELLHTAQQRLHLGMEGLAKWLAERRHSQDPEDEEHQLRLESDEHLVKIVTVHKSKGLEYPVVFCPFLWDGKLWSAAKESSISFHDPDDPTQVFLDLGSAQREERRPRACQEELAENLRLFYVALTRTQYQCYLVWGNIFEAGTSAPAWLLHPPSVIGPQTDRLTATAERYQAMTGEALRGEVESVVQQTDGAIHLASLSLNEGIPYQPPEQAEPVSTVRRLATPIRGKWRVSSFTALTMGHEAEQPDYDPQVRREEAATEAEEVRNIFTFPRGARAGRCLHSIFEFVDFTQHSPDDLENLVKGRLEEHGFETDWTAVVTAMVERTLTVPLAPDGLCLAQVTSQQRLNELEFCYPLTGLSPTGLRQVLAGLGSPFVRQADNLDFAFTQGYMKGFIDLVFEAGGRFYLVDYKSNWLGMTPQDYRPERLAEVMARESYYLQYLIYTVALHRYLRLRLPDYAYDRHFGGVFYLFVRGIEPSLGSTGIFRDLPERRLVEALDTYLASGKT